MTLAEFFASERGAQARLAETMGIPAPMLSQWASGARRIPAERCPDIRNATNGDVTCAELRPDIDWEAGSKKAPVHSKGAKAKESKAA